MENENKYFQNGKHGNIARTRSKDDEEKVKCDE